MEWLKNYGVEFYRLMSEMAPYLLLGFLFAGLLKGFFPADRVVRFMGRRNFRSVFNAAVLGVPMPLCSCGVIPTAISFFRNGASRGATTSFLISTPQTGVDSILATYAMLGLPFAVIRPVVAFITGIIGGMANNLFVKGQEEVQGYKTVVGGEHLTFVQKIKQILTYGFGELLEDILKWLLIGLAAAAFLSLVIPDSFFSQYVGNQWIEMLVVLAAAAPMYICATGSIPLAAVLLMKGMSPGAALVLLMAGPATNIATMMVISKTMGKKTFLVYLGSIIGGALLSGFMVNTFMPADWFMVSHMHHHSHSEAGSWINLVTTVLLVSLMLVAAWNKWIKHLILKKDMTTKESENQYYTTISVEGMTCNHCRMTVEKNLASLEGIDEVSVDLPTGQVKIGGDQVDLGQVAERVKELGYTYNGKI